MAAGSKWKALAFNFSVRVWCMFLMLKCRGKGDLVCALFRYLQKLEECSCVLATCDGFYGQTCSLIYNPKPIWGYTRMRWSLFRSFTVTTLSFLSFFESRVFIESDSGYPKDKETRNCWKPWDPLQYNTPRSDPPVLPSLIPGDLPPCTCRAPGRGPSHQSACSNIETRMDRPKSEVRVIRGVA